MIRLAKPIHIMIMIFSYIRHVIECLSSVVGSSGGSVDQKS